MPQTYYFVNNGRGIVLETTDQLKAITTCMRTPRPDGYPFNAIVWSTDDLEKTRRKCRSRFGKGWLIGESDIVEQQ